jgi:hypothetical protein
MPLNVDTIILKKLDKKAALAELDKIRARVKGKLSEDEINAIVHKIR